MSMPTERATSLADFPDVYKSPFTSGHVVAHIENQTLFSFKSRQFEFLDACPLNGITMKHYFRKYIIQGN